MQTAAKKPEDDRYDGSSERPQEESGTPTPAQSKEQSDDSDTNQSEHNRQIPVNLEGSEWRSTELGIVLLKDKDVVPANRRTRENLANREPDGKSDETFHVPSNAAVQRPRVARERRRIMVRCNCLLDGTVTGSTYAREKVRIASRRDGI